MFKRKQMSSEEIHKNRWIILAIVVLLPFMASLDSNIVNIALPTIETKLRINMASAEWIVSIYLIIISATILLFGRIGDMKSKTLVFINGILVFTIGSFLCGISGNIYLLVASRVVQAIGAALVMSTNQGIITAIFSAEERGKALGVTGAAVALGALIGPGLGGIIITYLTWHYIFLINVPIGVVAYILARKYIPVEVLKTTEKIDGKGVLTFFISIVFIFSAIMIGQQIGFSDIYIVCGFIIGFFAFAVFVYIEKKAKSPMLDLSLFKNLTFTINLIGACISFIAINTVSIIEPFYLQDALGFSAFYTSIIMMSSPIIMLIVAPLSGHLSDKIGNEILNILGIFIIGIALILLSTLNIESSVVSIVLFLSTLGFANGLFKSPNTNAIMSSVPKNKLGIAGGTNALIRNVGLAIGVSVSTTFLYKYMSKLAGYKVLGFILGKPHIFIFAMRDVYLMVSILCFIAFILFIINIIKVKITRKNEL